MSSGVKVNDDCAKQFDEIKNKHSLRYAIFKIGDDKKEIIVDKTGDKSGTYADFLKDLSKDEPRYCLIDYQWKNADGVDKEDLIFIAWSPDSCGVKLKMLYASSLDAIKKKMDGCKKYLQCCDDGDLSKDDIDKEMAKK